jgi:hypothetical protein
MKTPVLPSTKSKLLGGAVKYCLGVSELVRGLSDTVGAGVAVKKVRRWRGRTSNKLTNTMTGHRNDVFKKK